MAYIFFCVLCYFFQIFFLAAEAKKHIRLSLLLKGLASASFVALGIYCMQKTGNTLFAGFVVSGLILDAIADVVFNIRFLRPKQEKTSFLAGTAFFFAGHLLYLASLLQIASFRVILFSAVITAVVIVTAVLIVPMKRLPPAYRVAGVIYFTTICLMVCMACGNFLTDFNSKNTLLYLAGAVLFISSDIILVTNTFTKHKKYGLRVTNLVLYYTGQLLISFSLLFI